VEIERPAEFQQADPSGLIFGIVLGLVGLVGYVPVISLVLARTQVRERDTSPTPLHTATTHRR